MFSQVKLEPLKETAEMTDEEIKKETFGEEITVPNLESKYGNYSKIV